MLSKLSFFSRDQELISLTFPNAIPHREQKDVAAELAGIWKAASKEEALTNLSAFKGKYRKRYPEAVRSLCEEEDHLLTFYAFPQVMHRYIRTTNAIESL